MCVCVCVEETNAFKLYFNHYILLLNNICVNCAREEEEEEEEK